MYIKSLLLVFVVPVINNLNSIETTKGDVFNG